MSQSSSLPGHASPRRSTPPKALGTALVVLGALLLGGALLVGMPRLLLSGGSAEPIPLGQQVHDGERELAVWVPRHSSTQCWSDDAPKMEGSMNFSTSDDVEYTALFVLTEEGQSYECNADDAVTKPPVDGLALGLTIAGMVMGLFVLIGGGLIRQMANRGGPHFERVRR